MKTLLEQLEERFAAALSAVLGEDTPGSAAVLRPSQDPRFGDFQANCAMALAKRVGAKPREIAQRIYNDVHFWVGVDSCHNHFLCTPP